VAIVVSLRYVLKRLRAYRATIRVLEDDLRAAQNRELSKADQKLGVLYLYDRDGLGSMILTLPDRFSGASVQRGFSSNTTAIGPARLHRSGTSPTTRWWSSD
jgi:hypothetical protein